MKRPIVTAFVFYVMGILAGQAPAGGLVLFFMLCVLLCVCFYCKWKWRPVFIFILFWALGVLRLEQGLTAIPPEISTYINAGEEAVMTGVVKETGYTRTGRQKILLELHTLSFRGAAYNARLRVQAVLPEGEETNLGDVLQLAGTLQVPEKRRNPGGFDEEAYLRGQGVQLKTFPRVLTQAAPESEKNPSEPERHPAGVMPTVFPGVKLLNRAKTRLAEVYDSLLPEKEAAIIKSMIIGDKSGLPDDVRELYRLAGIYHILAISGLHISILALAANRLLLRFFNRKLTGLIVMGFLTVYCILTGSSVSTVRAVIMSSVVIAAPLLYRSSDLAASTAFAGLCLLIYRPFYLWDIGFQYSFASVFGIAAAALPMERLFFFIRKKIPILQPVLGHPFVKNTVGAGLAATLATAPVAAYHFYTLLPYGFFVNLLIIPTVSLVVILGLLTGILGMLHYGLALFLSGSLYYGLSLYEWICRFFISLPFSVILCGSWPIPIIVLFYLSLGVLVYWLRCYGEAFRQFQKWSCAAVIFFMMTYGGWKLWPSPTELTMLDVGQGDCFVIRSGNRCFIIDGGGWFQTAPGPNTGSRVLTPFLDYYAIDFVDGVFVTHGDADHITGIMELLDEKKIGGLYLPDAPSGNLTDALIYSAEKYKIPVSFLKKGDQIQKDGILFDCLHPDGQQEGNAASLVLKLELDQVDFLFTGDIDETVEDSLRTGNSSHLLKAAVLKAAHHGSKYASSAAFLQAVAPDAVIISAGAKNVYGHPANETLDRIRALQVPYYITAEYGAISIQVRGGRLYIQTML